MIEAAQKIAGVSFLWAVPAVRAGRRKPITPASGTQADP